MHQFAYDDDDSNVNGEQKKNEDETLFFIPRTDNKSQWIVFP